MFTEVLILWKFFMVYNIKYKQAGYKPITAIKSEKRYTYKERNMLIS